MHISLEGFALHVQNVEQSLAFYQRIPGAEVLTHQPGHIAIIRIGKNTVNLVKLNLQPPFHFEIETDDVDALYATFKAAEFPVEGQPENKPWGERTFYAKDPDGNWLEFSTR